MFVRPKESFPATSKKARYICDVLMLAKNTHFTPHFNPPVLREKMAQAYDFALDKIGMEIMSYQVHKAIKFIIQTCLLNDVYISYCPLTCFFF